MRLVEVCVVLTLLPGAPVFAARQSIPSTQELAGLEARAALAPPERQCLLYARLVRSLTDLAVTEMRTGEEEQASNALRSAQDYVSAINMRDAKNAKKLKDAEILIRESAFRIRALLMDAPLEDRPALASVLKQLDNVESALLMRVMAH